MVGLMWLMELVEEMYSLGEIVGQFIGPFFLVGLLADGVLHRRAFNLFSKKKKKKGEPSALLADRNGSRKSIFGLTSEETNRDGGLDTVF